MSGDLHIYWSIFAMKWTLAAVRTVYDTATAFVMHEVKYLVGLKGNPQEVERVQF